MFFCIIKCPSCFCLILLGLYSKGTYIQNNFANYLDFHSCFLNLHLPDLFCTFFKNFSLFESLCFMCVLHWVLLCENVLYCLSVNRLLKLLCIDETQVFGLSFIIFPFSCLFCVLSYNLLFYSRVSLNFILFGYLSEYIFFSRHHKNNIFIKSNLLLLFLSKIKENLDFKK